MHIMPRTRTRGRYCMYMPKDVTDRGKTDTEEQVERVSKHEVNSVVPGQACPSPKSPSLYAMFKYAFTKSFLPPKEA